ncbi:MAG: hypothetical protein PHO32_03835 [Candidatus Cloacimonetes bacterium]|nr:hypothetical protein [Candidatus Cloacimonadota bacterium]
MKFVLLLLFTLVTIASFALSFEAEELRFSLQPGFWEMEGLYHFANHTDEPISQVIFFPIPADSLCAVPTISKVELAEPDSLASCVFVQQNNAGFYFRLSMPEKHFCTVQIVYKQVLSGNYASYIITSANKWGKPLSFASYSLVFAHGITITELPFPVQQQGNTGYFWEFYDFSPQGEFLVRFNR